MEDVLDVYERPYDPLRPVICLDESRKELRETPQGSLPMTSEHPRRDDYEYERQGSCDLFLWVEPLGGRRHVEVTAQHTYQDCARVLRHLVDEAYPQAQQLVLVVDNLNTHSAACLYETFSPAEAHRLARKLEWHYTPEHGSWLNIAECELSVLARQCLNRRIPDAETLAGEVQAWEQRRNQRQIGVDWQFRTQAARLKLKRLYPVVKEQSLT